MTAENKPILRGKSMELLNELTQILHEIYVPATKKAFVGWKRQSAR